MNRKLKYIAALVGTVIGVLLAHHPENLFWTGLAVPFGIIGYSVGALLGDGKT